MEQTEALGRRRVHRAEQQQWLDLTATFVRDLQALHSRIIVKAQRQYEAMLAKLEDDEHDWIHDREDALLEDHLEERRINEPVERQARERTFQTHVANRRTHEARMRQQQEDHESVVAATMQARQAADERELRRLDRELQNRIHRELSRDVHLASPSPILGDVRPTPTRLSPLSSSSPVAAASGSLSTSFSSPVRAPRLLQPLAGSSSSPSAPRAELDPEAIAAAVATDVFMTPIRKRQAALDASVPPSHSKSAPQLRHRARSVEPGSGATFADERDEMQTSTPPPDVGKRKLAPIALDMDRERKARDRAFRLAKDSHNHAMQRQIGRIERDRHRADEVNFEERCAAVELAHREAQVGSMKRSVMAVDRMINPARKERDLGPLNVVGDRSRSIGSSLQTMQEDRRDMIDAVIDVERTKLRSLVDARQAELLEVLGAKKVREIGGLAFPAAPGALHPNQTQRSNVAANVSHAALRHEATRTALMRAIETGWDHSAPPGRIDLSNMGAGVGHEAWTLSEKVVEVCPTIATVDVRGAALSGADCDGLVRLLLRFAQLAILQSDADAADQVAATEPRHVPSRAGILNDYPADDDDFDMDTDAGGARKTVFGRSDPHATAQTVYRLARENAEIMKRRRRLEAAKAKKAGLAAQEKSEAAMLPAIRKRAHVAFELLRDTIDTAQSIWRAWIGDLEQVESRERIRTEMLVDRYRIRCLEEERERSREKREELSVDEDDTRFAIEGLHARAMELLRRTATEDISRIMLRQRAHEKKQADERDALALVERDARLDVRRSEQVWRKLICVTQIRSEAAVIEECVKRREDVFNAACSEIRRAMAAHQAQLQRERAEAERRRVEEEKLKLRQRQQRDALDRSEGAQRERVLYADERADRTRLSLLADELFDRHVRECARNTRLKQRSEHANEPVDLVFEGIPASLQFAMGSMAGVPLIPPDVVASLHLRPKALPPYMTATRRSTTKRSGAALRSSSPTGTAAAATRSSSKPRRSKQAAKDSAEESMDPAALTAARFEEAVAAALPIIDADEITESEWIRQKSKFLGASVSIDMFDLDGGSRVSTRKSSVVSAHGDAVVSGASMGSPSPATEATLLRWSAFDTFAEDMSWLGTADGLAVAAFSGTPPPAAPSLRAPPSEEKEGEDATATATSNVVPSTAASKAATPTPTPPARELSIATRGDSVPPGFLMGGTPSVLMAVPRNDGVGATIVCEAISRLAAFRLHHQPQAAGVDVSGDFASTANDDVPSATEVRLAIRVETLVPTEASGTAERVHATPWSDSPDSGAEATPVPPRLTHEDVEPMLDSAKTRKQIAGLSVVNAVESAMSARTAHLVDELEAPARELPLPDFEFVRPVQQAGLDLHVAPLSAPELHCRDCRWKTVTSETTLVIVVRWRAPLLRGLAVPTNCACHSLDLGYRERQGDGVLLPVPGRFHGGAGDGGSSVGAGGAAAGSQLSLGNADLIIDYGPLVDPRDTLWISLQSSLRGVGREIKYNGIPLATLTDGGLFRPTGASSQPLDTPTATTFRLAPTVTPVHLEMLLKSLVFRNDSRDPSGDPRRIQVTLRLPGGRLSTTIAVTVTMAVVDDPIMIDWRHWRCVPYHSLAPPPAKGLARTVALKAPLPCYLLSRCAISDPDSPVYGAGYLSIRIVDEVPGEALQLAPWPSTDSGAGTLLTEVSSSPVDRSGVFELHDDWTTQQLDPTAFTAPLSLAAAHSGGVVQLSDDLSVFGGRVVFRGRCIATVTTKSSAWIVIDFLPNTPLEGVQALVHTIAYMRRDSWRPRGASTASTRTAELVVVTAQTPAELDGAVPVRRLMPIRVLPPLVTVSESTTLLQYAEGSGAKPLAVFDVCAEDHGWDGGFILAEFVLGATSDDCLVVLEDEDVRLVEMPDDDGTRSSVSRTTANTSLKGGKGGSSMSASQVVGAKPRKKRATVAKGGGGELQPALGPKEVAALLQQRTSAASPLQQQGSMQKTKGKPSGTGQAAAATSAASPISALATPGRDLLMVRGVVVASVTFSATSLKIHFDASAVVESSASSADADTGEALDMRASSCVVKRGLVQDVLRHIGFENVSRNPRELNKAVRLTACNGTVHPSVVTVGVNVQVTDDLTEVYRTSTGKRELRVGNEADRLGYCPFDDCVVDDADTFSFNGAILNIDIVSGGDAKGDSLGLLPAETQQRTSAEDGIVALSLEAARDLLFDGVRVGTIDFNVPSADGMTNIRIVFRPLASEHVLLPVSHDEAEQRLSEGIIGVNVLQRILRVITFTSRGAKIRNGTRTLQVTAGPKESCGKLKVPVTVQSPVLWLPDFGSEVMYRQGTANPKVFPKLVLGLPDNEVITNAVATIAVADGTGANGDRVLLELPAAGKSTDAALSALSLNKNTGELTVSLAGGRSVPGGTVTLKDGEGSTGASFALACDWESKMTVKQFTAALRRVSFNTILGQSDVRPRTVSLSLALQGVTVGSVSTVVSVISFDEPTTIELGRSQMDIVRGGLPVHLAPNGVAKDPDTLRFERGSWLKVSVVDGVHGTDLLHVLGAVTSRGSSGTTELTSATAYEQLVIENAIGATGAYMTRPTRESHVIQLDIVDATLPDLTAIVRNIQMQCLENPRDRAYRKQVVFEVKTGDAVATKSALLVEVKPPLVDLAALAPPAEYPLHRIPPMPVAAAAGPDASDWTLPKPLLPPRVRDGVADARQLACVSWQLPGTGPGAAAPVITPLAGAVVAAQHFTDAAALTVHAVPSETTSTDAVGLAFEFPADGSSSQIKRNERKELLQVDNGKKIGTFEIAAAPSVAAAASVKVTVPKDRSAKTTAHVVQRILGALQVKVTMARPEAWGLPAAGQPRATFFLVITATDDQRGESQRLALPLFIE